MLGNTRLRALLVAATAATFLVGLSPSLPTGPAAAAASPADEVVAIARSKIGARYAHGAAGPTTFDCSGLVIFAFRKAGFGPIVGNGRYRSAAALYRWFKARGLASRSHPEVGDIVVWGGGQHVGIYVGGGQAISALTNGVRRHGVRAVVAPFTAYLHTGMTAPARPTTSATATVATRVPGTTSAAATRRTVSAVNLRDGPGTSHVIIRVLKMGTRVAVIGTRRDAVHRTWYRVTAGNRSGWLAAWLTRAG